MAPRAGCSEFFSTLLGFVLVERPYASLVPVLLRPATGWNPGSGGPWGGDNLMDVWPAVNLLG